MLKKIGDISKKLFLIALQITLLLSAKVAHASSTGGGAPMPWDTPLHNILANLTGTTAHVLLAIAVIGAALGYAFSEHGSALRKAMGFVFAGAIAMGAGSIIGDIGISGAVI